MDLKEEVRHLREENSMLLKRLEDLEKLVRRWGRKLANAQRTTEQEVQTEVQTESEKDGEKETVASFYGPRHETPKTTKYRGPATSSRSRTKRRKNV